MNRTTFQRIVQSVVIVAAVASTTLSPVMAANAPAATTSTPTGTAGGGNCSTWASIKEAMFGVHCGFYM